MNQKRTLPTDRQPFTRRIRAPTRYGYDEALMLRLWNEKRGEAEPEDLSKSPRGSARTVPNP